MSVFVRTSQRFNVESRAHKVISADKPKAAPKYESNVRDLQRALEADPQLVEKLSQKNEPLDSRLKQVFVTSQREILNAGGQAAPEKSMPLNRTAPEDFEFGYQESARTPTGKVTMRNVLKFLGEHQAQPEEFPAARIATDYGLPEEQVENILKHYKMLALHVNDPRLKALPNRTPHQPLISGEIK